MPFLLTYAVGFNLIPVGRWLLNKRANSKIAERNMYRRQWATVGKNGGVEVDRKLKAAKSMTTALKCVFCPCFCAFGFCSLSLVNPFGTGHSRAVFDVVVSSTLDFYNDCAM